MARTPAGSRRLRRADLSRLLAVLPDVYALTGLDGFPGRAISAAVKLIPSEVTPYNEIDPAGRRVATLAIEPAAAVEFPDSMALFEAHVGDHPWSPTTRKLTIRGPCESRISSRPASSATRRSTRTFFGW